MSAQERSVGGDLEAVREALDWSLGLRHATRRETRYGENNYWDVDVHTPDDCKRCDAEAALARIQAELERLRAIEEATGKHLEDCCRTDIGWREQMASHDRAVRSFDRPAALATPEAPAEPLAEEGGRA